MSDSLENESLFDGVDCEKIIAKNGCEDASSSSVNSSDTINSVPNSVPNSVNKEECQSDLSNNSTISDLGTSPDNGTNSNVTSSVKNIKVESCRLCGKSGWIRHHGFDNGLFRDNLVILLKGAKHKDKIIDIVCNSCLEKIARNEI